MSAVAEQVIARTRDLERINLAPDARTFDCKFIEPGIVSYADIDAGMELLKKETIDAAMPSVIGIPVTVPHVRTDRPVGPEDTHGIVTDWYFDPEDGWYHVKGVIESENAKRRIRLGERASCGYIVTAREPGAGRTYHGIRYKTENTGIKFHHLAIVPKGRYEEAAFRLNSTVSQNKTMPNVFKLLRKLVTRENAADGTPDTEKVSHEAIEVDGETTVEIDGVPVRLNELVEKSKVTAAPKEVKASLEDEIEVDGKPTKIGVLVDAYRTNAAAASQKKDEGQKTFITLAAARENQAPAASPTAASSNSLSDRVARAKNRY